MATVTTWATAPDLAAAYQVAVGTIYAWASQDHWARKGWPRQYSWDDAQASWERRHRGDWQHYAARADE